MIMCVSLGLDDVRLGFALGKKRLSRLDLLLSTAHTRKQRRGCDTGFNLRCTGCSRTAAVRLCATVAARVLVISVELTASLTRPIHWLNTHVSGGCLLVDT